MPAGRKDVGAIVSFVGYCRDEGGQLAALELEHYPGMAEEEMARVGRDAEARWPLLGVTAIHRYGRIAPGEQIVLVAVAVRSSRRSIRGGRNADGFPQNPRALLEARHPSGRSRRRLGRRQERRWKVGGALGRRRK